MIKEFYVYGYYEEGNDKPFYIGKGKGLRSIFHLWPSSLERNTPFYNKLRAMLAAYNRPIIKKIKTGLTEQEAFDLEVILISEYGRVEFGGTLYNLTSGGEELSGRIFSEETIEKRRIAAFIREPLSTEGRLKISNANEKRKLGKDYIEKQRKAQKGIPICCFSLISGNITFGSVSMVRSKGYNPGNIRKIIKGYDGIHAMMGWRRLTIEEIKMYGYERRRKRKTKNILRLPVYGAWGWCALLLWQGFRQQDVSTLM